MLTMFHAVKGGSGTTVTTALTALAHRGPTLLVDLDDELPAALGVGGTDRPGVVDWLGSDAPLDHLSDLMVEVNTSTSMLTTRLDAGAAGSAAARLEASTTRWMQLSSWCRSWATRSGGRVFVDAGTQPLPQEFVAACDQRLLVTRSCYLALREASRRSLSSTGVVVVREPGRTLTDHDIATSVGAPVSASLTWEPAIARSVDAGLLTSRRVGRSTSRELRRLLRSHVLAESIAA
ncbi:hypothetical protein [Ilumatobacter coccineus]|uniref:CobQ/CobB/MinD/ParA nucleotide binding domain-containing protein n=1 Tax=Ilumatobacter coccineus (strain NBRC 103263 / KCTC 29153 / YM16-304) TaxID=1313172 RepID=A0A6C7E9F1_ILUCY|nr:hypothetical protein [Ilumatobacter coccineus]BAN00676.1 hypothetical protein YM304_03620 [Ilumatobacter coccineus YM16-304]